MSAENGKFSTMSSFKSNPTVPAIKKEPTYMTNGDSLRLSSFSSPRDLTLGGRGGLNKKVFTPNLNVVRNKNAIVKTSKDTSLRGRSRSDRGKSDRGGRGRGRGGNSAFIQTAGVFSEGAGGINIRRTASSSSFGRSAEDVPSNMRKPTLIKRESTKIDVQADAAHVRELIGDSDDDDLGYDEKTDLEHIPIKLSIEKWKQFKMEKTNPLLELKMEFDDKSDTDHGETKKKIQTIHTNRTNIHLDGSTSFRYPTNVDEIFHFPQSQLFLMQLPDTLPCEDDHDTSTASYSKTSSSANCVTTSRENSSEVSPESLPTTSSSCLKSAQRVTKSNTIKEMEEGQIGKLLRYKSGKCKLILGESHFDLDIGMETGFLQDLISINTNREERNGNMINLGPIQAKITATPDWEYLLKHQ